jgi:hypothetical protein
MDDLDDVGNSIAGTPLTVTDPDTGERSFVGQINRTRFSWVYDPDLVIVPGEFDADGNQTKAPVKGGPHLRVLIYPHGAPGPEHDQLRADLDAYIRGLPWDALDTPQAALDRLGLTQGEIQTYRHYTPRETSVIVRERFDDDGNVIGHTTVPERPKGGWA